MSHISGASGAADASGDNLRLHHQVRIPTTLLPALRNALMFAQNQAFLSDCPETGKSFDDLCQQVQEAIPEFAKLFEPTAWNELTSEVGKGSSFSVSTRKEFRPWWKQNERPRRLVLVVNSRRAESIEALPPKLAESLKEEITDFLECLGSLS